MTSLILSQAETACGLIIHDGFMQVPRRIGAEVEIVVLLPHVQILFYSIINAPELIAIEESVGAQGFVTKDQMAARLLEAVDALRNKKMFFSFYHPSRTRHQ